MRKRLKKMHWRVFYISLSLGVILVSFLISTAQYEIRYVDNDISTEIKEIRYKYVHLRRYKSTQDSTIELWALIYLPAKPSPILVTSHGWHGTLFLPNRWEKPSDILKIVVDMRGRAFSNGKPDLSGWELQDWIDAVNFARKHYADYISDPEQVYVDGGSGAGGNVYALIGKYPDFFTAAFIHAGMSDYTDLYLRDEISEFRDEMEGEGWIGGTPDSNSGGYRSRGGITTVRNLLTPVHIDHGETDIRVPVSQARQYVKAARSLNKTVRYIEWPGIGDRRHWSNMTPEMLNYLQYSTRDWLKRHRKPPVLPTEGQLIIAGFLKTNDFHIVLDNIDKIGSVEYKLQSNLLPKYFLIDVPPFTTVQLYIPLPDTLSTDYKITGGIINTKELIGGNWNKLLVKGQTEKISVFINYLPQN